MICGHGDDPDRSWAVSRPFLGRLASSEFAHAVPSLKLSQCWHSQASFWWSQRCTLQRASYTLALPSATLTWPWRAPVRESPFSDWRLSQPVQNSDLWASFGSPYGHLTRISKSIHTHEKESAMLHTYVGSFTLTLSASMMTLVSNSSSLLINSLFCSL